MFYRILFILVLSSLSSCKDNSYTISFHKESPVPFSVPLRERLIKKGEREEILNEVWQIVHPQMEKKLHKDALQTQFDSGTDSTYTTLLTLPLEKKEAPSYLGISDDNIIGEVTLATLRKGLVQQYLKLYILIPLKEEKPPHIALSLGAWILE